MTKLFVGVGMMVIAVSAAAAERSNPGGKELYLRSCSACHGSEGKGDGVVSGFMTPRPTDLTQMAKKNGGQFPFYRTMRIIDGRETLRAHGDPDMPVWGELFTADEAGSTEEQARVRGKLLLITEYLESIQAK